jgi:signal transduction histidine kinase
MIDLYPPDLDSQHLATTIENLAAPLRERGLQVDVSVTDLPELDVDTLTTLYRVVREALANAAEHAQATRLTITLGMDSGASTPEMVVLEITDDGIGIDQSRLDRRSEGHLGLMLLIDRVAYLGGHLTIIAAAAGRGTTVRVELPVVGAAADLNEGVSTGSSRRRTTDRG